jgi:hypothetical protein
MLVPFSSGGVITLQVSYVFTMGLWRRGPEGAKYRCVCRPYGTTTILLFCLGVCVCNRTATVACERRERNAMMNVRTCVCVRVGRFQLVLGLLVDLLV